MRNKISFFLILALVFVLVFSACELNDRREGDYDETADTKISETKPSETERSDDYIVERDGNKYIVLPISGEQVCVWREHEAYLRYVDTQLLRSAEEKILGEISKYSDDNPAWYFETHNGQLYLAIELIIELEPPTSDDGEYEMGGCGIDHDHLFFREPITGAYSADNETESETKINLWSKYDPIKISVSSMMPEGYNYSFNDEEAMAAILKYFNNLTLISNFSENPDEYGGMSWIVEIEYENGEKNTVVHFGNMFVRVNYGCWYKMNEDEAGRFHGLLKSYSSDKSNEKETVYTQPTHTECAYCGEVGVGQDRWFIAKVMGDGKVMPVGEGCFERVSAMDAGIWLHYSSVDGDEERRLQEGDLIRVTYNGLIMESYPAQISATTVEIVK